MERPKFNPETIVHIDCSCGKKKRKLKDFCLCKEEYFFIPNNIQCVKCLDVCNCYITEESK